MAHAPPQHRSVFKSGRGKASARQNPMGTLPLGFSADAQCLYQPVDAPPQRLFSIRPCFSRWRTAPPQAANDAAEAFLWVLKVPRRA